jgi:pimeloyl-ACP methyl ester carboxylesterase
VSALALLLAVGVAAAPAPDKKTPIRPKIVHFKTDDGWTLEAFYAPPKKDQPVALLVHGVAAGRGEYDAFAATLQAHGWGTLALDLRGHGGSTTSSAGPRDFTGFDKTGEWTKIVLDLLAASQFLEQHGVKQTQLELIGASIGANACAQIFTAMPFARGLVLLSPGAEYRGVRLPKFDAEHAIAAYSPGDTYAFATVQALKKQLPALTVLTADKGHGAQMFGDKEFVAALLKKLGAK